MVDWSNLPEELLPLIAARLFSVVELKRFSSICKSWQYSVSGVNKNYLFPSRPIINFNPIAPSETILHNHVYRCDPGAFLSRAAFFRVTLSSSPTKGWMIKSDVDINSGKFRLLNPLSRFPLRHSSEGLNLLEFTVSEFREAYAVLQDAKGRITTPGFQKSVLVKVKEGEDHHHGVLGIGREGHINYWDGNVLKELKEMGDHFSDIIVHKGVTYVLDSKGIVWCINSDLEISRYVASLNENITINGCWVHLRFVECCGELYVVERIPKENPRKRKWNLFHYSKTAGFKVYKMDVELGKWIEVKTLGDNAFVMATDTCFSVLAHEFYGCLPNSIYFIEDLRPKVFQLDNGNGSSITSKSESSESSFEMFFPSFL
ncbi:F-box-like domain superfamily [Arabidopsis suecica]|uniref:F-box-like domain superfamily n=1 Tax=Arabidopsis suecica TaxID=45249 RepID=A0A8T2BRA6_ARASU|nr:F-box-like domain superfamily [Arabidopsis suecica]